MKSMWKFLEEQHLKELSAMVEMVCICTVPSRSH